MPLPFVVQGKTALPALCHVHFLSGRMQRAVASSPHSPRSNRIALSFVGCSLNDRSRLCMFKSCLVISMCLFFHDMLSCKSHASAQLLHDHPRMLKRCKPRTHARNSCRSRARGRQCWLCHSLQSRPRGVLAHVGPVHLHELIFCG